MRPDDSAVPHVGETKTSAGWRMEHHKADYAIIVIIAPDGRRYTQAADDEPATLIRTYTNGLPPSRYVDLDTSRALSDAAKRAAEVETGGAIIESRRKKNKQIRQARVKRHKPEED